MVATQTFNPVEDCIDWFLQKYPRTSNALVDRDYLVHIVDRPSDASYVVNNLDESLRVDSGRNTTLSDLLTNLDVVMDSPIATFPVAPRRVGYEKTLFYTFNFIRLHFIRELAEYFRSRGIIGISIIMSPAYEGSNLFGMLHPFTTLTVKARIETEAHGSMYLSAYWDLNDVLFNPNVGDITLADAVNRVFASYRALSEKNPFQTLNPQPRLLPE